METCTDQHRLEPSIKSAIRGSIAMFKGSSSKTLVPANQASDTLHATQERGDDEGINAIEQMEVDGANTPEGAMVFRTFNARDVKGKVISTNWAVLIAGMNGTLTPYIILPI